MPAEVVILLVGVYLVGAGLMMSISPQRLTMMFENIEAQPAISYLTGVIMALIGAAILYMFHDFSNWSNGLVTLMGIVLLVEGWMLMATPALIFRLANNFMFSEVVNRVLGSGVFALGCGAIWFGIPR